MARSALLAGPVKDWDALMRSPARLAPATSVLLVANVVAYAAMLVFGGSPGQSSAGPQLAWGANFGPATQDHQWWRLASAMFVHFGLLHLAVNMWALWDIGRLVERLYGSLRFALLYAGAGVLGNLLSLVIQNHLAVSAGASGAILGLYGALLVCLWQLRRTVDSAEFRWIFTTAALFSLLMLSLGWAIPGIDNAAHVGGLVSGGLWGLMLTPRQAHSVHHVPKTRFASLGLIVLAVTLVVALPPAQYRYTEELQARKAIQAFLTADQQINQRWDAVLKSHQAAGLTFAQLAGQVDVVVAQGYAQSFEQLAAARPVTNIPSAQTLLGLQNYAAQRTESAHALADGLRSQDAGKIREALARSRQAAMLVAPPPTDH